MKDQATGTEMTKDSNTSHAKSFDSRFHTLKTDAPNTFLIPISFLRCSA